MPAPNPLPKYIYKIVSEEPAYPLPAEYPLSELDKNDGFIHLSTAAQASLAIYSTTHPQLCQDEWCAGRQAFARVHS
jgi:hypothetical protein